MSLRKREAEGTRKVKKRGERGRSETSKNAQKLCVLDLSHKKHRIGKRGGKNEEDPEGKP